ncbi:C40 family peptidase [Saccharomonospora sp. NPDC046836]|uniref:C40 family peptidase n=1 Tax=Saccharomonospora sp. NPDC046836 TaxID=3156921 RepID=UPI0033EFBDE3
MVAISSTSVAVAGPPPGAPVNVEQRTTGGQPWSVTRSAATKANGVAVPVKINRTPSKQADRGTEIKNQPRPPEQGTPVRKPINQRIVDAAARLAGKPYAWGAAGPNRFDCSGLTQFVHRQIGIQLPRTSRAQRAALRHIAKKDMKPGDLVFFAQSGRVYHVGIFAGNNTMWASPQTGDVVRKQRIWTQSFTVGRAW